MAIPIPVSGPAIGAQLWLSNIMSFIGSFFRPSQKERIAQINEFCRNPASFDPRICGGPVPWGSIYCPPGWAYDMESLNKYGAPTRCKCPLTALFDAKPTGCGTSQILKDNAGVLAIGGLIAVFLFLR